DITEGLDCAFPKYTKLTYGHLGDSNIHLTISTGCEEHLHTISDIVYGRTQRVKGSISGEHGIGVIKRKYLSMTRTPEEVSLMRCLKRTIDPKYILNAGRVIPTR